MFPYFLYGQNIEMSFPKFGGKSYDFIIFQGAESKTIYKGVIPDDGKFVLEIPADYAPYTGMSRWLITGTREGGGLDMFIPGYDFSVSSDSSLPNEKTIVYKDNAYNTELSILYKTQEKTINRYESMRQLVQVFTKKDPHYDLYKDVLNKEESDYSLFHKQLNKRSDYISHFLRIVNITRGLGMKFSDSETERAKDINNYMVNDMKWDYLYTSGHWYIVINSWLDIHTKLFKDPDLFRLEFEKISNKLTLPQMYISFVERIAYFLKDQDLKDYIMKISPLVRSSNKILDYSAPLDIFEEGYKGKINNKETDLNFEGSNSTGISTSKTIIE